jgi:Trk K+ transport system NAD-binding subunit
MGAQVVVVDNVPERLEQVEDPYLVGDCTRDEVLRAAGIDRARALIASLETDADTVYLTLSARALRPDLVIISRARTADSKEKLVLAGATRAVNPQMIGGRRMAAFALNAHVAEFLDVVMHDEELDFRIEQIRILPDSPLCGRTLGEADLEDASGAKLLAYRPRGPYAVHAAPATGDDALARVGAHRLRHDGADRATSIALTAAVRIGAAGSTLPRLRPLPPTASSPRGSRRPSTGADPRRQAGGLGQASGLISRTTRPVRSFGVKKVDLGGMSSPSRPVRSISVMLVGRIRMPASPRPPAVRSSISGRPCW